MMQPPWLKRDHSALLVELPEWSVKVISGSVTFSEFSVKNTARPVIFEKSSSGQTMCVKNMTL